MDHLRSSETREAYFDRVETLTFPIDFGEKLVIEQQVAGEAPLPVFSSCGRALLRSLREQGVVDLFEGQFDPFLLEEIRRLLDKCSKNRGAEALAMTSDEFSREFLVPNQDLMIYGLQSKLRSLFDLRREIITHRDNIATAAHSERTLALALTVLREHTAQLTERVMVDAKTRVGSNHALIDKMRYIQEEHPEEPYAVIFADIDHFKAVNDLLGGHEKGDMVLESVAKTIQSFAREGDVFRFGGEEFVVIFKDGSETRVLQLAEAIRLAIQTLSFTDNDGQTFHVTVSLGVAVGPGKRVIPITECDADGNVSLLNSADAALYRAKGKRGAGREEDPRGINRVWCAGKEHPEMFPHQGE